MTRVNAEALSGLLATLDEQAGIYARLSELAVAETAAIRGRSLEALSAIVTEQTALSATASGVEHRRTKQLEKLGFASDATMEQLAALVDSGTAAKLQDARANLLQSIDVIRSHNRDNEAVLRALAKHYGQSAQALIRRRATYSAAGEVQTVPADRRTFERKA